MSDSRYVKIAGGAELDDRSICGFRTRIFKEGDGAPASFSHLRIHEAQAHWHNETHEFYYVLEGEGTLHIDDEPVPIAKGDCVWIKPGAVHRAEGDIEALVIGVPPFHTDDTFLVE